MAVPSYLGVYLSVYLVLSITLEIFFIYFGMWVDSFNAIMLLLHIYLFCSFMLFDSGVRLLRSRQTRPVPTDTLAPQPRRNEFLKSRR